LLAPQTSKELFWETFVMASAPGHALGLQDIAPDAKQSEAEIRLAAEQVLAGRLVDLQGQPAPGVRIHVVNIAGAFPGKKRPWVNFRDPPQDWSAWPQPTISDDQGKFSLRGLTADWSVSILIQDDHFARQRLQIEPRVKQKTGEPITLSLAPARVLEGNVIYADTGKPVPNARVVVQSQKAEYDLNPTYWLDSQADEKGRFHVVPYVGNYFVVIAYPPAGEPYLLVWKDLNWPKANVVKQEVHLALPRGILVLGTVTEAPSGKPVAGARIEFLPFQDHNPFYRRDALPRSFYYELGQFALSGADGRFELVVLPGPGHLLINGPSLDYIHAEITTKKLWGSGVGPNRRNYLDALVALDLKPQAGPHQVAVTLRRGVTLTGNLVGPDGTPVQKAVMMCRSFLPYGYDFNGIGGKEITDGHFELPGCDPQKTAEVFFLDAKDQLGAKVEISPKENSGKPVTVRLERCGSAKARFLHEDGKPTPDEWPVVKLVLTPGDFDLYSNNPCADVIFLANVDREHHNAPNLRTDAQGRATLMNLIPGAKYWVEGGGFEFHKEFTTKAGEMIDLGDIIAKKSE